MPTRWYTYDSDVYYDTLDKVGVGDVLEVSPYLGGGACTLGNVVFQVTECPTYRRGQGYFIEATLIRAGNDFTEKILSGKLEGALVDMIVHMCETAPGCARTSRRLARGTGSWTTPTPLNGVRRPPGAATRALALGSGSAPLEARVGTLPLAAGGGKDSVVLGAGEGRERSATEGTALPTEGDAAPTAEALRAKLGSIRDSLASGPGASAAPRGRAGGPGIVEAMRRNVSAHAAGTRSALPGPRPGERALPAAGEAGSDPLGALGDAADGGSQLFRGAPTRVVEDDIVAFARAHPGQLLNLAVEQVDRFLSTREGAGLSPSGAIQGASRFVAWLTTVFHAAHPPSTCGEWADELRTICETLDAMTGGDLARAGDLLTQRLKAVGMKVAGESPSLARQHELIPPAGVSLVSQSEMALAGKQELLRGKLAELAKKKS